MSTQNTQASWLETHITLHSHDTPAEERASALAHAIGVAASLVALVLLVQKGIAQGETIRTFGYAVYGAAMVLLYLSSTLYHLAPVSNTKRVLRICDHMSIYLLIAGTYTPIMLTVGGFWGIFTFGLVWVMAAGGMAFKIAFWGRYGLVQVLVYILMGWLIILVWEHVKSALSVEFLYWALAGGIVYTSGTIVYAMKRMPYYHALWHLFVVGGSVCFFLAIYLHL